MRIATPALAVLAWLFASLAGAACAADVGAHRLGITLATDKATYAPGEAVAMRLAVFNRAPDPVHVEFRTGQRFDFAIMDANGEELWRWSAGRMFSQMLGTEALGPEAPQRVYEAVFDGTLAPGRYVVRGWLTSSNRPMAARITISVR